MVQQLGHCYGVSNWRQIDFEWIQIWSKLKNYTKTNQIKIYWSWILLQKKGKQTKFGLLHKRPAWGHAQCTGFTGQRQTAETKQREKQHQCFDKKKKKVYWLLQSSSSIQIHTKVYKQHSKWHVFYATLKWTNINQKLDITLSVRLCTNIKQIKTYITMAVTWVRINYWIQQKTVFNVQSRNHFFVFFYHIQIRLQKQG